MPAHHLGHTPQSVAWQRLSLASWIALGTHLAAGAATAFILKPGLETNPDLPDRLRYITENEPLWIAAWLVWNAAALSILYFYACFVGAHDGRAGARVLRVALLLSVAGIVPDLTAEAVEMGLVPQLAEAALPDASAGATSPGVALFLAVHRGAVMATGYVANGLYSLSALLLVWSTRQAYAWWIVASGLTVAASGLFLSAAVLADSVSGMVGAHFVLVPSLLVWQAGVALDAARRARQSAAGSAAS